MIKTPFRGAAESAAEYAAEYSAACDRRGTRGQRPRTRGGPFVSRRLVLGGPPLGVCLNLGLGLLSHWSLAGSFCLQVGSCLTNLSFVAPVLSWFLRCLFWSWRFGCMVCFMVLPSDTASRALSAISATKLSAISGVQRIGMGTGRALLRQPPSQVGSLWVRVLLITRVGCRPAGYNARALGWLHGYTRNATDQSESL